MRTDPDCIFCKIVAGEIPCFKLYEDEHTFAFMDINPASPGHALAIAKAHWQNIHEIPGELAGACIAAAQRVAGAVETALSPDGINLLQANGPGAGQSVQHFHIHIMPRYAGDEELKINWGLEPGDRDGIEAVYGKIAGCLQQDEP